VSNRPTGLDAVPETDELRAWFDDRVATHEFSGVALVRRSGSVLFSYAGGIADRGQGVLVSDRTRFAVASITKVVTAITLLRLVERGTVRLDQPLVEILPAEQRPDALIPRHTVHHLLSHTSGLANYHDDDDPTWGSFTSCWDRVPMYHVRHPADMLPLFGDLPASFEPGARFQYSDTNFILAGLVIEAVTGRPYVEVATDEVLVPAGLVDTRFDALDMDPERLATGYLVGDGPYETWRSNIYSVTVTGMPDGGIITTAVDLATLFDALLGGRLVSPGMLTRMTSPQGPPTDAIEQYGYGLHLVVVEGTVTILGQGGSDPGVSALVTHHPVDDTTIVVLCNHDRGSWAATQQIEAVLGLPDARA
jgi:CubicO group peptidase (beta-lactamase class C family)